MAMHRFSYEQEDEGFSLPDSWPSFPSMPSPPNGLFRIRPRQRQFGDLPQEIRDRVVRHLRGYKEALRACALTHSSMTHAAQRELHHTIKIGTGFLCYRTPDTEDAYSNPRVAGYVRSLLTEFLPPPESDSVVWKVLRRFSRLQEVKVTCHDALEWQACSDSDREMAREIFSSVKTVEIRHGYHDRLKDFLLFLSAFQNMTTLKLPDLRYSDDDDDDDDGGNDDLVQLPKPLPGARLRTLEIIHDNRDAEHLTQNQYEELAQMWLAHLAKDLELGLRFKWDDLGSDDVKTFPRFMQALAPVLSSLEVSLSDSAVDMDDFGIRDCTELRNIELGPLCRPFRGKSPKKDADAWVPQLLSNIRSTNLTTITLKFAYESVTDFRALDFAKLSQVLLRPPLCGAKVILSLPDNLHGDRKFHLFSSARMAIHFHDIIMRGMLKETIFH